MHDIRTLIGKLNFMGGQRAMMQQTREMAVKTAALFRGPVDKARETLGNISALEEFHDAEAASWLEPQDIADGKSGGFDACDLRHWLIIADKAGVKSVPATEILSLSEDELSAISGPVELPGFARNAIARGLRRVLPEIDEAQLPEAKSIDKQALSEKLYDVMDDVPFNCIVRSNISGPSTLKAFAGAGVLEYGSDSMKLGPDLEVGPGWVRTGNRRRVDASDKRFIETFAGGHKDRIHYMARPWVEAGRRADGPDPHRHGTPFAGKGSWPLEWRVFIENGKVTGVASYYGWVGSATPENAARAFEAADLAQRMVDWATNAGLSSRWMDIEMLRGASSAERLAEPEVAAILKRFPREAINCTLDFIEVAGEGMMFLEGGPAHTPMGGGHPCAFAGHGVEPGKGIGSDCQGVALKIMDHVCLGDPKTWAAGDTTDCILTWDEAAELASQSSQE